MAVNRVKGTYGGWSLGNVIRSKENEEKDEEFVIEESAEDEIGNDLYAPTGSYNPKKWHKNWEEFQNLAYLLALEDEPLHFIKFDVANFYDSINLDLLERKIRSAIQPQLSAVVDLLFVLLRNWNRRFEGYGAKSVGLPQDETGDCSRILANFYLQDYDHYMHNLCSSLDGKYLRYTDDQIVLSRSQENSRLILFKAANELHKIGLNINAGKVDEFTSANDFNYYWAFDIFEMLEDYEDVEDITGAARIYVERMGGETKVNFKRDWRFSSVRKRIINVGVHKISEPIRSEFVRLVLNREVIAYFDYRSFSKLMSSLRDNERVEMLLMIESMFSEVPFNGFHLNVLRFYEKSYPSGNIAALRNFIEEISLEEKISIEQQREALLQLTKRLENIHYCRGADRQTEGTQSLASKETQNASSRLAFAWRDVRSFRSVPWRGCLQSQFAE